jgi:hypothetical protein
MYIMIFHPDNDNYKRYKLNRLDDEVQAMVSARLDAVQGRTQKTPAKATGPRGSAGTYGFTD